MAAAVTAPSTYKQPSRKGKKAWRKNVDVTEIASGLENAREELIHGGIISEKASEDLFILDTTGSAAIKAKHLKHAKPLKADEIIAARASGLPALSARKRKTAAADEAAAPAKRSKRNTYVSHEEVMRLKALAANPRVGDGDARMIFADKASHDPWADEPAPEEPELSYLDRKRPTRAPASLKQKPVSLAASGKAFPAVRRPGADKSYNPNFEDWAAALEKAGEKEVEAERKRLREEREEAERMEKALAEAARVEPAGGDGYESAWESEWEGIKSEGEEQEWLDRKRPERKSQVERNKIKRRKAAERLARHEGHVREREAQAGRVEELAREARGKEAERRLQLAARLADESEDDEMEEKLRRRPLGKNMVPEAALELVLADELQDSLRTLRPEGNLLQDRFRNMLVNGKVEVRKAITQPKKPKRTHSEKWSYKDWKLR